MKADALLDSNLLIAMLAEAHDHHALSPDLLIGEAAIVHDVPVVVT
ncbi:hypothetical protein [Sphingobium sp. CFD-1]|nr:hypothetical protein [Sphingobium sp. CFD-1]